MTMANTSSHFIYGFEKIDSYQTQMNKVNKDTQFSLYTKTLMSICPSE